MSVVVPPEWGPVQYINFYRSGTFPNGVLGLTYTGNWDTGGTTSGTYSMWSIEDIRVRRLIMTTNGNEFTGGSLQARLYNDIVELYETPTVPQSDFIFSTSSGVPAIQDTCSWISPELNLIIPGSPTAPSVMSVNMTATAITGGPEGIMTAVMIQRKNS